MELGSMAFLNLFEDGGLDVREERSLKKLKQESFDEQLIVDTTRLMLLLGLGKYKHDKRLVGLFVKLTHANGWTDKLIPSLDVGSQKEEVKALP